MAERGIRSLVHLENCASTARVLNLLSVWRKHQDNPEYQEQPFFKSPRLNRALILKHRLRRDELDLFRRPPLVATKIVFPVDHSDLRVGGKFAFVGQKNFAGIMEEIIGQDNVNDSPDLPLLKLLDTLPSLDPFLVREQLKRGGYQPARCYLKLSDADLTKIFSFVSVEIEPLVRISLGRQTETSAQANKLVTKILSNTLDADLEPFRQVLRLSEIDFREGIFCWKGFLYYKWVFREVQVTSPMTARKILNAKPHGCLDAATQQHIERMRQKLATQIMLASRAIKASLDRYDAVYAELTTKGNPIAFRDFLLNAPASFTKVGELLGVLQHINSLWNFRFPENGRAVVEAEELVDIFNDFDCALQVQRQVTDSTSARRSA